MRIYDLKTEYRTNPMGIDNPHPRFSWKLQSDKRNVVQKSYRIVAKTEKEIVWDSGVVESADSQRVVYCGLPLLSRQTICWSVRVTVCAENGIEEEAESEYAYFEMGLLCRDDWRCQWIEPEREIDREARKKVPYLRRVFELKSQPVKARIYTTAHGLYSFWINGEAATKDKFLPGLTSYYYRIQYQVYDITELLHAGKNAWSVMLGDGWWRGSMGGPIKNNYGYKVQYFGQIEVTYSDGNTETIGTDEKFKWHYGGLIASDILYGDIYDANREVRDWQIEYFDDSDWENVHSADAYDTAALIASASVPVREHETFVGIPAYDSAGNRIVDFGQNIAGYVKMRLRHCVKGQKIVVTHGEALDTEGRFSVANVNQYIVPVPAFQEVVYIAAGQEEEIYCPRFSVFGFRYIKIEGYDGEIGEGDFIAVAVYSDMEQTGDFSCSNTLINKLVSNSRWSQKGNFLDVAVDCPTRERNAWTGDSQVYCRTAAYFMNVYPFFEKWLTDQKIEQYDSGKLGITFPSTSSVHNPEELPYAKKINPANSLAGPTGNGNIGEDCAGWGDSSVWNPYSMYLFYGDKQILINQYETAKRWVNYMLSCAREHNPLYEDLPQYRHKTDDVLDADYIYDTRMHYGEWQEPIEKKPMGKTLAEIYSEMRRKGQPLVATAYMKRSADNLSHIARILGIEQDAAFYTDVAQKIRSVYDRYLIADNGVIEPGHQAAYVRALAFDLCSEQKRPLVEKQLIKEIENNGNRLNTGFLSTPFLLPTLVEMGRADLAFAILEQTEYPSWLHSVLSGATTIPESWDGFDKFRNSLNHYSYGAVCEFLFGYVGGIRPIFDGAGFERFLLKPIFGGSLTHAKATYESLYGRISSNWRKDGTTVYYECEIPVNTHAHLILPTGKEYFLGSGKYQFAINEYEGELKWKR